MGLIISRHLKKHRNKEDLFKVSNILKVNVYIFILGHICNIKIYAPSSDL